MLTCICSHLQAVHEFRVTKLRGKHRTACPCKEFTPRDDEEVPADGR